MTRCCPCSPGDPRADPDVFSRHNPPQILATFGCTSSDAFGEDHRPSHGEDRAALDVVKALASLDPAGCGRDGVSAQLESSTYVMADKTRPQLCVDAAHWQSYR